MTAVYKANDLMIITVQGEKTAKEKHAKSKSSIFLEKSKIMHTYREMHTQKDYSILVLRPL